MVLDILRKLSKKLQSFDTIFLFIESTIQNVLPELTCLSQVKVFSLQ